MPRPLRIEYAGARYHVMCRSNRGAVVFAGEEDARLYLKTLAEVVERTDWRIHAFVLMRTHYHLLIETPTANLVAGMKWFQGTFTQRMNAMHQTWGHLFQGRYKAKVIDDGDLSYFQDVADYIHLNPAAAGLCGPVSSPSLESYTWSSYPLYLEAPSKRPVWIRTRNVLEHHRMKDTPRGRKAYRALMDVKALKAAGTGKQMQEEGRKGMERGWVHGEAEFRRRMLEHLRQELGTTATASNDAAQSRDMSETAAEESIRVGLRLLCLESSELVKLKKSHEAKLMLAAWIKTHHSVGNTWISERLSMGHRSLVGHCQSMIRKNPELKKKYDRFASRMDVRNR